MYDNKHATKALVDVKATQEGGLVKVAMIQRQENSSDPKPHTDEKLSNLQNFQMIKFSQQLLQQVMSESNKLK